MADKLTKITQEAIRTIRFNDPALEHTDLFSVGYLAAQEAEKTFDPTKGKSLRVWQFIAARRAIIRYLNKVHRWAQTTNEIPETPVEPKHITDGLTALEQAAVNEALYLFNIGIHRTKIREYIRRQYGKKVFNSIKNKLQRG